MAGIKTAKSLESIQRRDRITKDATGTVFITFIGNQRKASITKLREANMANARPDTKPIRNPQPILERDESMGNLKVSDGSRS